MTKIFLNNNQFNDYILNDLEKSIINLKSAYSLISNISIPYGFSYRNYLRNLISVIKNDAIVVESVYKMIKDDTKEYIKITEETYEDIENITDFSISLRQSTIK